MQVQKYHNYTMPVQMWYNSSAIKRDLEENHLVIEIA